MKTLVLLGLSLLLFGCEANAPSLQGSLEPGSATADVSDPHLPRAIAAAPAAPVKPFDERVRALAAPETFTVRATTSAETPRVGVLVTYRPASAARAAECSVTIVEEHQARAVVVETSADMLQCSTLPSVDAVETSLQIRVQDKAVELEQTGSNREARFALVKVGPGDWRVGSASFNFVETDPETITVEAISESVQYRDTADMPKVSDYSYSLIKPDLIRQRVE